MTTQNDIKNNIEQEALIQEVNNEVKIQNSLSLPLQEIWKALSNKKYKTNFNYGKEDYPGEYQQNMIDKIYDEKIKQAIIKYHHLPHRMTEQLGTDGTVQLGTDVVIEKKESTVQTLEDMVDEIENERQHQYKILKKETRKLIVKKPYVFSAPLTIFVSIICLLLIIIWVIK